MGPRPLPPTPGGLAPREVADTLKTLDHALGDASSYAAHGARLKAPLQPLALSGLPEVGPELSRRLNAPFPGIRVSLFGGLLEAPAAKLGRWYLLWAIALNGHGRVPPTLLGAPWTERPNRPEKYLEAAPAAAWTVAQLRQTDAETLAVLIARLGAPDHPSWLDGDFVGALSALTGERFGYDVAAWRIWWARRPSGSRASLGCQAGTLLGGPVNHGD